LNVSVRCGWRPNAHRGLLRLPLAFAHRHRRPRSTRNRSRRSL
jgi:hypothetical protein